MASYELIEASIDQLELDKDNFRIWRFKVSKEENVTEDTLTQYLIKHEKLADLKSKIFEEGWESPNEPFVIALDNGRYLVKEGNRRVAAVKSLIKDNKEIKNIHNNKIGVKLYTDMNVLKQHISKIHTEGNEQWDPWAKALDDLSNTVKSKGANLLSFILSNNITDITESADCYTNLLEGLVKSQIVFSITFTDAKFDYKNLGLENTILLIKRLIGAYKNGKIDTRANRDPSDILEEIKQEIDKKKLSEIPITNGGLYPQENREGEVSREASLSEKHIDNENTEDTQGNNIPRRKYPESILEETFKEWVDILLLKYSTRTRSNISFLLLKDLKNINKSYTHQKLILCRTIWDALLYEYSNEKRGDKVSIESKSESICGKYTEKLKSDFPDIKDIAKQAQNYIGLLNDVVHGVQYKREPADLYSTLTDIYPLFSFLVDLINEEKTD